MKNSAKILFMSLCLLASAAEAAVCTSLSDGNWNVAARWDCGHVPLATDTVVIAHNVILNANDAIAGLTVNAGASLVDNNNNNRVLTITGDLLVNGTIDTGGGRINLDITGASSVISGSGTLVDVRLYSSGAAVTIAAGSSLNFTGASRIYTGLTQGGTTVAGSVLTINGTINSSVTSGTTDFLRLYANSTVIGTSGVINAAVSSATYNNSTATVTNNGNVNLLDVTRNSASNAWTQGANAALTLAAPSTVGTLNASANGNTITYNGTSTVIAPSAAGYWNLAGTIFPGACPVAYTVQGSNPCMSAPIVTTGAATALTASGATLNGTVSSNGGSTTVTFDYGTTTGYGSTVTASASPLAAGATNSSVSAVLTGLTCGGTTYHFRVKGVNSAGTANGGDVTFATPVCPPPVVVLGKTAGASAAAVNNYVTFSLTATNPTTTAMSNVVVTDAIPVGMTYSTYAATLGTASVAGQTLTWTIPSIPGGGTAQLTLVVLLTQKGTFTNTVKSTGAVDASASMLVLPSAITRYSMDEAVGTWNGTTGEVIDNGGNALNGRRRTTATPTTTNTVLPSPTIASQHASVVGDYCNAGNFDGNAVVESASSTYFQFTQTLSASAWIYPTGYPSGASDLYSILSNDQNYEFHLNPAGHLYWWWGGPTLTSAAVIPLNQWTHIAITFDSTAAVKRQRIYINGVQDANTNNWTGTLTTNTCPFYIGGDISTNSGCALLPARNFHGKIDEAKIYNYELSAAEVNADMNLGRLCGAVSFDHIQIEHDGTASTCAPKVVTVKACMNSACTSLYPGTVTVKLTPTGWIPGDILTINGGVVTATLNNSSISAPSLTLGTSSVNPAAANATRCFNGSTETCTLSVAATSCSFDVAETGGNPQSHLYTKLAGTPFNVDVLALSNSTTINTTYTGTVTVELVDTSTAACSASSTVLSSAPQPTITYTAANKGRYPVSLTCANAAPSAQVRIKIGGSSYACSYDKLAVRPSAATLTTNANAAAPDPAAATIIKAGQPFNMGATTTPVNYAGALTVDATKLTAQLPSNGTTQQNGGAVGTLTLSPSVIANTVQSNNAAYTEVGYLYANAGALRDTLFTSVDQNGQTAGCSTTVPESCDCLLATTATNAGVPDNMSDVRINGRYGCYVGNKTGYAFGRFIPDHFDTAINVLGGVPMLCPPNLPAGLSCPVLYNGFVYSGQPFATQVTARNLAGGTTQNYTGKFAKAVTQTVWAAIGDAINQNPGPGTLNISAPLLPADFVSGLGYRVDGAGTMIPYVIYTLTASPANPTDIYFRAQDTDGVSSRLTASPATSIEGGVKVMSGQIKLSNAYGSELLPLTLKATVQYYTPGGWLNSITDSITGMTLAANYNVVKKGVATGTTTPTPTGFAAFVAGQRSIVMGKPSGAATGTALVTPVTPGYLPLIPGSATFGIYKSNSNFIYRRESY